MTHLHSESLSLQAKRTLITRYESDLKDNNYWLGLITHLQSDYVPRKIVSAVADLKTMYEVTSVEDIYTVYNHIPLDDNSIFTAIGVAGPTYGGNGVSQDEDDEPVFDEDGERGNIRYEEIEWRYRCVQAKCSPNRVQVLIEVR